jgi:hypothetical protein
MFITFIDSSNKNRTIVSNGDKAIQQVRLVQQKFGEYFSFYFVENSKWGDRRKHLGISWDDTPAMAFNMADKTVIPYP